MIIGRIVSRLFLKRNAAAIGGRHRLDRSSGVAQALIAGPHRRFSEMSHGQRLEELLKTLGENFPKNADSVKVGTVSHPITNKDLTRRST